MLVAPSARDLPLRLLALGISASTMKFLLALAPARTYAATRWLMAAQCLIFANAYAPRRPVALVGGSRDAAGDEWRWCGGDSGDDIEA